MKVEIHGVIRMVHASKTLSSQSPAQIPKGLKAQAKASRTLAPVRDGNRHVTHEGKGQGTDRKKRPGMMRYEGVDHMHGKGRLDTPGD